MSKYETYKNSVGETMILRTDEDGTIHSIPSDPKNSDYQRYLAEQDAETL